MACGRNEIIQHVLPVLDALSGRIVTSLALYDRLTSAPSLTAPGPGQVADTVSSTTASALAKTAGALSKVRSGAGSSSSASAILEQARAAVSKISARVSSQLSHPAGAAYLNEALTGLTSDALAQLTAFTRALPGPLGGGSAAGRIGLAAQSIVNFVLGDEATVMAYAQLLADHLRLAAQRELDHLARIEQSLMDVHALALRLYDGPWVQTTRFRDALAQVTAGRDEVAAVRDHLDRFTVFDATAFERSLRHVHQARDLLAPADLGQAISPTGRARDLSSIALDALRIAAARARILEALPLSGVEHGGVQDLMGALVSLEREWPAASKKATRQILALETFRQSLADVALDIDRALAADGSIDLARGQAEWLLRLSLAAGQVELSFNPITRAALARQTEFAIATEAFGRVRAAILDVGPLAFEPTQDLIRSALDAAPAISAGATGGRQSHRDRLESWTVTLVQALRGVRDLRRYLHRVLSAVAPLNGFTDSRLESLQALLGAYRLDGWQALLTGGRLSRLLDLSPNTVTQAGVALDCFHSLLPTAPPKQRRHLQALVDRLEEHRRIEELLVARQDDLQVLYEESLDRETGQLTGIHTHVTDLVDAMLEESQQDADSPGNSYADTLRTIDASGLDPEAAAQARRAAAETFFLTARGVA